MNWYEIPLTPDPQQFGIPINGVQYTITLTYRGTVEGGWFIDLGDGSNNPILTGIPLVTGLNLLDQYTYLGIGGQLYVFTDGDLLAEPTENNLGVASHLYFAS